LRTANTCSAAEFVWSYYFKTHTCLASFAESLQHPEACRYKLQGGRQSAC